MQPLPVHASPHHARLNRTMHLLTVPRLAPHSKWHCFQCPIDCMQPSPFQTFAHLTSPMLTGSYLAGADLNTRRMTITNHLSTVVSPCLAGAFPTSVHLARPSLSAPRRSTPLGVSTEMISCKKPSRCKQPLPNPTAPGLSRPHPSIDYRCPPHTRRSTFSNALSTVDSPCCSMPD